MDHLSETIGLLVNLAASYRVGTINEAEQVVDSYLVAFQGYHARKAAMDALLNKLHSPTHRTYNRGGLFDQVERHSSADIARWHASSNRIFPCRMLRLSY